MEEEEAEEIIEINFRLDADGRTILPQDAKSTSSASKNSKPSELLCCQEEEAAVAALLNYQPRTIQASFTAATETSSSTTTTTATSSTSLDTSSSLLDELLLDCEIADSGLMPRTFWMPVGGTPPRFSLEQMALNIFDHHVRRRRQQQRQDNTQTTTTTTDDDNDVVSAQQTVQYDPTKSGAEWWVQIRPSPEKTGRYAMLEEQEKKTADDNDRNKNDDHDKNGITFHWDKDEDLRLLLCGGNTYIHPHLSTVTYLTDKGAPTLAVNCRIHNLTGEWIVPSSVVLPSTTASDDDDDDDQQQQQQGFVSWPRVGKHLSFDGRFLHAAPTNLMPPGLFDRQCQFTSTGKVPDKINRRLQRRHRRVTFLCNIWLNFKPFNVDRFPESMMNKMSGYNQKEKLAQLLFPVQDEEKESPAAMSNTKHVQVINGKAVVVNSQNSSSGDIEETEKKKSSHLSSSSVQEFSWPMGGCGSGEMIKVQIPLEEVQSMADAGGNVKLEWKLNGSEDGPAGIVLEKNAGAEEDSNNKRQKVSRE